MAVAKHRYCKVAQMNNIPSSTRQQKRKGAAVVELAVVTPFLAMLVLGVCELGQSLRVSSILAEAGRNACTAAASPGGSNSQVTSQVTTSLANAGLNADSASVTVYVNGVAGADVSAANRLDKVTVSVSVPWKSVNLSGTSAYFMSSTTLSNTTTMLKQ